MNHKSVAIVGVLASVVCMRAQSGSEKVKDVNPRNTTAHAMQEARPSAMVSDHSHEFELTPDGGLIAMQRASGNANRVAQIREHIEEIANLFASGDFRLPPGSGRANEVPGAQVMLQELANIKFRAEPIPRGAEVVIRGTDPKAIAAIHEFLEFHRSEHEEVQKSKN